MSKNIYNHYAFIIFFSIAVFLLHSQKVQNSILDAPPWGISLSQLQKIKGPAAQRFETPKIYNYESTAGLEVTESLFGYNFRARYFFSPGDARLYKITFYLDQKIIGNASVVHAFEQIKKYVKSMPDQSFFSHVKKLLAIDSVVVLP